MSRSKEEQRPCAQHRRACRSLASLPLTSLLPALLAAAAWPAAHAETSPYYIGASQTFSHSTNLLGLSDNQPTPAGFSKSDTVSTTALLAGFDQPISRQRVFGNFTLRSNRLSQNDVYDNLGYSLLAGIDWATVNNISGNVKASSNRNLASFNTTESVGLLTKKNLETAQQGDAVFRIGVVTAWTAEAAVGVRSVDYTAAEYQGREFRQNSASAGMRYTPSAASNFGAALRQANGRYPKFTTLADGSTREDRYKRRDVDLTAFVAPSGLSSLNARISIGKTDYDVATQRDFSGITGQLVWNWKPTGKLRFSADLQREPGQDSYFLPTNAATGSGLVTDSTVDFSRLTNSLRLRTEYDIAAKVTSYASVGLVRRSLTNTLQGTAIGGGTSVSSNDSTTSFAIGANWTPTRNVTVGCDATRDQRSGDAPLSSNLHASTFSCFGQVTLQ